MGINTLASLMDATPLQTIYEEYNKIIDEIITNEERVDYIKTFKNICVNAGIKNDNDFVALVGMSRSMYQRLRYSVMQFTPLKTSILAICVCLKPAFADSVRLFIACNVSFFSILPESAIYLGILYNLDKLPIDRQERIDAVNEILTSNNLKPMNCNCE